MLTGIARGFRRKRRPVDAGDIAELNSELIVQIFQMQVAKAINNVNGTIWAGLKQDHDLGEEDTAEASGTLVVLRAGIGPDF